MNRPFDLGHFGNKKYHHTRFRKLDGISQDIEQNLMQPVAVSHEPKGNILLYQVCQIDSFGVRIRGDQTDAVFDRIGESERGMIENQLTRLYFRKIQNVIQNAQQDMGAIACRGCQGLLLRRKRGFAQESDHAEDSVHRSADLMAHICQKL